MNYQQKIQINKFKNKPILFSDSAKIANIADIIAKLPPNSAIIIREYHLNNQQREAFAQNVINLARSKKIRVLIGKNIELALKSKADGVHFSDNDKLPIKFFKKNSFKKNFMFSIACHNEKNLLKYHKIAPTMLFLSPIFTTTSHINAQKIGHLRLAKIINKHKNNSNFSNYLYALGGINNKNIKQIQKIAKKSQKPVGFGAIDYFLGEN